MPPVNLVPRSLGQADGVECLFGSFLLTTEWSSSLHGPGMRVVELPERRQSKPLDCEEKIPEGLLSYPIWTEFCK